MALKITIECESAEEFERIMKALRGYDRE